MPRKENNRQKPPRGWPLPAPSAIDLMHNTGVKGIKKDPSKKGLFVCVSDESGFDYAVYRFESAYKAFVGFLVYVDKRRGSGFAALAGRVDDFCAGFGYCRFDFVAFRFGNVHQNNNSLRARFFHRNVRVVDTVHDVAVFHKVDEFFARHNGAVVFRLRVEAPR